MTASRTAILLVEDSEEDYQTARRLLEKITRVPLTRCKDASAAMEYLKAAMGGARSDARWPSMILLDLNLPGEDGRSLLLRLKAHEILRRLPVVVLTTSSNPKDVAFCYENGAAGYIVKPVDLDGFRTDLERLAHYWFGAVKLPPQEQNV